MNTTYRPGKGLRLKLTEEAIFWLSDTIEQANKAFGPEAPYVRPEEAEQELRNRLDDWDADGPYWVYGEDAYGKRMVATYEIDDVNELRVAVIYTPRGEFQLDIRTWFGE